MNVYTPFASGAAGISCHTETKRELGAWFSGLAVYLSAMRAKDGEMATQEALDELESQIEEHKEDK